MKNHVDLGRCNFSLSITYFEHFDWEYFFLREQACRPLDISSILADSVRSQLVAEKSTTSASINWKLVISFPENHGKVGFTASRDRGQLLSFVVKERFKRGVYPLHNNIPQGLRKKVCFPS